MVLAASARERGTAMMSRGGLRHAAKRWLPSPLADWIRRSGLAVWPPVGTIRFGSLRRLRPISERHGFDRGLPLDRYYIERFLERNARDIGGRVLEIREDLYASRFAEMSRIEALDILDVDRSNAHATLYADLTHSDEVPPDAFDCIICTQTINVVFDFRAALSTLTAALRSGGVLLITVPGISRQLTDEAPEDSWRFTSISFRRVLEELFAPEDVSVETYGNVLTAAGFLYGVASKELRQSELDFRDERYEVIIGARAVKRG